MLEVESTGQRGRMAIKSGQNVLEAEKRRHYIEKASEIQPR